MCLLANNLMLAHQPFPAIGHARLALEKPKEITHVANFVGKKTGFIPSPLFGIGRVATAQNSTKFCGAMHKSTLRRRKTPKADSATGYCECSGCSRRQKNIAVDEGSIHLQAPVAVNGFAFHCFIRQHDGIARMTPCPCFKLAHPLVRR